MPDRSPAIWRKSSYSTAGGNCVELAHVDGMIAVRDSKAPHAGQIRFARPTLAALINTLKSRNR